MKIHLNVDKSIVLIFIFLGIIIFWVVYIISQMNFFLIKSTKTYEVNMIDRSDGSDHLYVPVTINNSVYPFLFDTGSSKNVIESGLARKIGLSAHRTVYMTMIRFNENRSDYVSYVKQKFSIGHLKTKSNFYLSGHKGLIISDIGLMQSVGAIMGMETIKHFNWLFNFADNTVSFSRGKITIPTSLDDQILSIDFFRSEYGTIRINLSIEGIIIHNVAFDTGMDITPNIMNCKSEKADIVFSRSDFDTLTSQKPTMTTVLNQTERALIIDSMQINDLTMQGILALEHKEYDKSYITAHFARRFRMMYIDTKNRKIQLYVSRSDSARHNRKDLQLIHSFLIHHSNEGDASMFSDEE